jgi:hypothetical protein
MFKTSHLQELKRRYASMYATPAEKKVIEDGTIEGVNQYKKDTPGQDIEKEFKEHCGVCGEQGIEEDEIEEGWPEIGKMKDSVTKMFQRIKDLKSDRDMPPAAYEDEVEEIRDKIREKQKKIKELETAQRAIDAKKKKTGPATGFSVGHRESVEVEEGTALQVKMALDDAGLKGKWKNNKVYVKKRDVKKAEKALKGNVIYRGKPPVVVGEEVEIDEAKGPRDNAELMVLGNKLRNEKDKKKRQELIKKIKSLKDVTKIIRMKILRDFGEEVVVDEAKGTAYPATVDTLRKIVKDKQHQTVMFKSGQALVDLFTASAMVQVYDALKKPEMKKHFEKMITDKAGFLKTQAFAMKMIGK